MGSIDIKERLFKKPPHNGKFYIVAIDGRGGSGKTTFADYLKGLLPDFLLINGDDYFEPDDTTIAWGSFNDDRFFNDVIKPLQTSKRTIDYRPYDWHAKPNISKKKLHITKGVCVERSFIYNFDLDWDLKIWVDAPTDLALERGINRDGMPRKQAIRQWKEVWQPQEDKHILDHDPLKTADIIIDGTKPFEEQIT